MNIRNIIITMALTCFLASGVVAGKKGRKLPLGAYVKSAKIEILSGDFERYKTAEALLDSLFIHYGPHAEGLHLMGQMMVDYLDKAPNPTKKKPFVEKLVAYNDSLHICCDKDNKEVKKKYKKNCDKFVTMSDSLLIKYWRETYNAGIEQMNLIADIQEEMAQDTDSLFLASSQESIDANLDSCVANMKLALLLSPSNYQGYIGIGSVYEKVKDYDNALIWLKKGLDKTDDRASLLLNIAYDHLRQNQFCEAIPYLKEQTEISPTDTISMGNLVICYNNCKFFDSALAMNQHILSISSTNVDALNSIGRFYNQQVRNVSDSVGFYQQANNDEKAGYWRDIRNEFYDSSLIYFKLVTEVTPEDDLAWEQYGTVAALRNDFVEAARAFGKLTELTPDNIDYWRFLGDCQLNNKKWQEAIDAYSNVVKVDETEFDTWERLKNLYNEIGQKDKAAEAEKKMKSLQ